MKLTRLMLLERRKTNMKGYLWATFIIPVVSLAFMYLFAVIPKIETEQTETFTHAFVYAIGLVFNIGGFACLCAVMFAKLVIEAYQDKAVYLTLSYPVSRLTIFLAKYFVCLILCGIGLIVSVILDDLIFFMTESILPLNVEPVRVTDMMDSLIMLIPALIFMGSISTIALAIGWVKKSIALTIIVAVLLFSLVSNFIHANQLIFLLTTMVFLPVSFVSFGTLVTGIKRLEV